MKEIKTCEKNLDSLKSMLVKHKEEYQKRKEEIHSIEKALFEKEFELKDMENEKAIRK